MMGVQRISFFNKKQESNNKVFVFQSSQHPQLTGSSNTGGTEEFTSVGILVYFVLFVCLIGTNAYCLFQYNLWHKK